MALEYVVVRCSDSARRHVYVDGGRSGWTDMVVQVDAGWHSFALCDCTGLHADDCEGAGYEPRRQDLPVSGTTRLSPLEVSFVHD